MANNKKINWLLILQGWAMLWVVIGHSGPVASLDDYPPYALHLWNFAYSFHMPLFIMVSGFLFYLTRLSVEKWSYMATMKEKMVRFGIPFVVFTLVALVLKSVFSGAVDRATTLSVKEFIYALLCPYDGPMREFWFLGAIIWLFAMFLIWKLAIKNTTGKVLMLLALMALNIWHPDTNFLSIKSACAMAVYFYIGILFATLYKENPEILNRRGLIPVLFTTGVAIYVVGRIWDIPMVAPIGGGIFSLAIALGFDKLWPKMFFSFRNYTYQIYLMGIFFNVMATILKAKLGLPFTPMQIVSLLLGLYMPVLISKLLEWINWKPLLLCVGLRQQRIEGTGTVSRIIGVSNNQ